MLLFRCVIHFLLMWDPQPAIVAIYKAITLRSPDLSYLLKVWYIMLYVAVKIPDLWRLVP